MLWVDYLLLAILGVSALFGLLRGLVRELLALIVWIVACGVATYGYLALSPYLTLLSQETVRHAVARLLLLLATVVAGAVVNRLLARLLHTLGLSLADRLLGLGFGLVRGAVMLGAVLFFWEHYFNGAQHALWQQSQLIPEAYRWLQGVLQVIDGT